MAVGSETSVSYAASLGTTSAYADVPSESIGFFAAARPLGGVAARVVGAPRRHLPEAVIGQVAALSRRRLAAFNGAVDVVVALHRRAAEATNHGIAHFEPVACVRVVTQDADIPEPLSGE